MTNLADQMAVYAAHHNDATNRAVHSLFVPAIVWSLMGLLMVPGGLGAPPYQVTLAHLASLLALAYYLRLDFGFGVALAVLFTIGLVEASRVVALAGRTLALEFFAALFVLSWAAQVVSHVFFERRKPAFLDDVKQVLVAPIFVVAEWSFSIGLRKQLQEEVARKMVAHLPKVREEDLPGRPLGAPKPPKEGT